MLSRHGVTPEDIIETDEGSVSSPLRGSTGALKLDHLDSFLRSGQAHGRTTTPPPAILDRLPLRHGATDTDPQTAKELTDLIIREATAQRSRANVTAVVILRHLVATFLRTDDDDRPAELTAMTDDEVWAALLADSATAHQTRAFRQTPRGPQVTSHLGEQGHLTPDARTYTIARSYLALPTVDGVPWQSEEADRLQDMLNRTAGLVITTRDAGSRCPRWIRGLGTVRHVNRSE